MNLLGFIEIRVLCPPKHFKPGRVHVHPRDKLDCYITYIKDGIISKSWQMDWVTSSTQNQQGENLGTNAGDREIHLAVRQR